MGYRATRDIFRTTVADIWRFIKPGAMLPDEVFACAVTCRARAAFDSANDYLVACICLLAMVPFLAVILFVIKRSTAIPFVKPVQSNLL